MTEPLTPADCDLRGMPFMPMDIVRVFDSDLYALSTGDEFKAAFTLWGKSFLQVPAASIPSDDRILAHLSGAGSRWAKVKAMALRGWIPCSDGRLYHPVVAEKAKEAWASRQAQRSRTEAARAARAAQRQASDKPGANTTTENVTEPATDTATVSVTDNVTGSKGQGQGQGIKEEEPSLRSGPSASPPPPEAPTAGPAEPPPDARTALFREGLARTMRLTGKPDKPSRALLGQWLRSVGENAAVVSLVLAEAEALRPADPVPWIVRALKQRGSPRPAPPSKTPTNTSLWHEELYGAGDPGPEPRHDIDGHAEEVFP